MKIFIKEIGSNDSDGDFNKFTSYLVKSGPDGGDYMSVSPTPRGCGKYLTPEFEVIMEVKNLWG